MPSSTEQPSESDVQAVLDKQSDAMTSLRDGIEALSPALSSVGGAIGSVATDTFKAYSGAFEGALQTGKISAAGIGKAMRQSAKQSLATLGKQSMVQGLFEVGRGLKDFASGDAAGGEKHMVSAAQFTALAALASAGGSALAPKSSPKKERRDEEVAPSGAGERASRVVQHITVIGNPT